MTLANVPTDRSCHVRCLRPDVTAGLLAACWTLAWLPGTASAAERVQFNRDVRPILADNCLACHGPDGNKRQADLRLDERAVAIAAKAIVPGKPEESGVVARVFSQDVDEMMPPPDSHKKLTAEQKELLRRWVAEGAEYQGHWAYVPPSKPEIPAGANPIDFLIRRHLQQHDLRPSPEADRRTLIRRLYLDLTGLPPKPEQVDAFAANNDPQVYAGLVEDLLASPHFGERLAIAWLDVVRFADTIGYHSDNPRNVWPYRDYVIHSFNENKSFRDFTIEQLAGDLLPNSTQEQRVGSCFNRLLLTTEEGGAQAKDYEARMLTDRVRAVGTVWLGQTLGCCQCHDHKFDPATTKDFYSLGAVFADVQEAAMGRREDGMLVPDERQAAEIARLDAEIAAAQQQVAAPSPELDTAQKAWEAAVAESLRMESQWIWLHPDKSASEHGVSFRTEAEEIVLAERDPGTGADTYRITVKTPLKGITGFRLEVFSHPSLPSQGPGRAATGNFTLTEVEVTDGPNNKIAFAGASASYEAKGSPASAAIDGQADAANGWSVLGGTGTENALYLQTAQPVGGEGETVLTFTLRQLAGGNQVLGRFRLAATTQPAAVKAPPALVPIKEIADLLKIEPEKRNDQQKQRLEQFYRGLAPQLAEVRTRLTQARLAKSAVEAGVPRCLTSVSSAQPRVVRFLPRGNWMDESGPVMQPALPAFLPGPKIESRRVTRLDLAQWLVSRENPLTARVFVNRLWKQFFGIGICRSLDDLGSQGEWPVHPQLLDWLACEFMDSGWNIKHLVRTIVTSPTYRQTSVATREQLAADPDNRLVGRQSRFRMEAELIRDNALSISGLLVPKIGGPSVKPYQPPGYWENLNFPTREYQADTGENQYRRGLYTWWQRTFLHPSLLAFDAPSREECAADRTRANTPQQALVSLNDPTYVETSRAFAARMLQEGGADVRTRVTWGWRQALGRAPRDDELNVVRNLLEKHLAQYNQDAGAATAVLKVGLAPPPANLPPAELAAWTNAARVILNLHETITRG
jgi:mono/diheme cytochrome c family protein